MILKNLFTFIKKQDYITSEHIKIVRAYLFIGLFTVGVGMFGKSCCTSNEPQTKYSIFLPDYPVESDFHCCYVDSYKEIEGGAIQFPYKGHIIRTNNFNLRVNY